MHKFSNTSPNTGAAVHRYSEKLWKKPKNKPWWSSMLTMLQTFDPQFYESRYFSKNISKFTKLLFLYKNYRRVVASEFLYDNCGVNTGYENEDRILENNISMFFRILYLNLIRLHPASKIVNLQFHNS